MVGGSDDFLIPAKLALRPLELGSFTGRAKTGEQKTEGSVIRVMGVLAPSHFYVPDG